MNSPIEKFEAEYTEVREVMLKKAKEFGCCFVDLPLCNKVCVDDYKLPSSILDYKKEE